MPVENLPKKSPSEFCDSNEGDDKVTFVVCYERKKKGGNGKWSTGIIMIRATAD